MTLLRARVFAIACDYPDADDLDDLRKDTPLSKLRLRAATRKRHDDLASQPTMSRWENAPNLRTLFRPDTRHGGPVVQEPPGARAQGDLPSISTIPQTPSTATSSCHCSMRTP